MDYMQEDLENMSKEYRFWVTERRVAQDRLGDEQVRGVAESCFLPSLPLPPPPPPSAVPFW